MSHLVQERGKYEPPTCPGCEQHHYVEWCEITNLVQASRGEQWYAPGRTYCRTAGCVYNGLAQVRPDSEGGAACPE